MQPIVEEYMESAAPPGTWPSWFPDTEYGPIVNGQANMHEAVTHLAAAFVHVARANVLDEEELDTQGTRVHYLCQCIIDILDRELVRHPDGYKALVEQKHRRALNTLAPTAPPPRK